MSSTVDSLIPRIRAAFLRDVNFSFLGFIALGSKRYRYTLLINTHSFKLYGSEGRFNSFGGVDVEKAIEIMEIEFEEFNGESFRGCLFAGFYPTNCQVKPPILMIEL
jgi:hypothetical protein